MQEYFIFDEVKKYDVVRADDYWYKLDLVNGKALYKSKNLSVLIGSDSETNKEKPIIDNIEQNFKIHGLNQNYYRVRKDDKMGVIDENSNVIIDFKYNDLYDFNFYKSEKVYFIAVDPKTGLSGVIDINENIIIPYMYDEIYDWNIDYEDENLIAEKDKRCAVINIHNDIIIDFKYKYILGFVGNEKYSLAQIDNNKWGLIDKFGNPKELNISNTKILVRHKMA